MTFGEKVKTLRKTKDMSQIKQNEDINIWYKKQSFYDINKERKIYQYIQNI